jgi:NTP pyrophosphatase (non-canonical NTP hydrolase)
MKKLIEDLREFAAERDWDQFHTPKNLAMALSVEVGELVEHFQWLTPEQSNALPPRVLEQVRDEVGDVTIYLARLSDVLRIDPLDAARSKLERNRKRYPVDKAKGRATKYTELHDSQPEPAACDPGRVEAVK